jgi:hypothetical protein
MRTDVTPEQAAAALHESEHGREAVSSFPRNPRWYAPAIAVAMVVFLAIQDVNSVALSIAALVVYAVAMGVLVGVVTRQAPYQPPASAWRRHRKVFAGAFVALIVISGASLFALKAAGFPLPGTVSGVIVAAGYLALDRWTNTREWSAEAGDPA